MVCIHTDDNSEEEEGHSDDDDEGEEDDGEEDKNSSAVSKTEKRITPNKGSQPTEEDKEARIKKMMKNLEAKSHTKYGIDGKKKSKKNNKKRKFAGKKSKGKGPKGKAKGKGTRRR